LLSALFYGLPKTELESLISSGKFISTIQQRVKSVNTDTAEVEETIKNLKFTTWSTLHANREAILARLFYLNLGRDYVNRLTAYVLTQSILFSPAQEVATSDASNISVVYNNLVRHMDDGYSMQVISYLYMMSDENWERFRSPEDNGREMLEIFLYNFKDSDVPKAAICLKDWKLDTSDRELVIGLNQNKVSQELLDTTVTTGFDFYRELVNHSDFTKSVSHRLVDMYFSEYTKDKKDEIALTIASSNPSHFEDILLQIVFSKEFLYNSSRVKSVEETLYGISKRLSFYPSLNYFNYMREYMDNMNQSPLKYKLGRDKMIPTDTLSFAYYGSFIKSYLLVNPKNNFNDEYDSGWQNTFISKSIPNTNTVEGLINHIFLTTVERVPTAEELTMFTDYLIPRGYDDMSFDNDRYALTMVVMEYLSRLSEVYTYQKIK